jgi:hypothetical protein
LSGWDENVADYPKTLGWYFFRKRIVMRSWNLDKHCIKKVKKCENQ